MPVRGDGEDDYGERCFHLGQVRRPGSLPYHATVTLCQTQDILSQNPSGLRMGGFSWKTPGAATALYLDPREPSSGWSWNVQAQETKGRRDLVGREVGWVEKGSAIMRRAGSFLQTWIWSPYCEVLPVGLQMHPFCSAGLRVRSIVNDDELAPCFPEVI